MTVPRRLSRLDPSPDGRMRCNDVRDLARHADAREFFRTQRRDSRPVDPGRLIESVFLGETPEQDADAVLVAWLAVLPKDADAPSAAIDLARHLRRLQPGPHEPIQIRLLDLLAFVAAHRCARGSTLSLGPQRKAKP